MAMAQRRDESSLIMSYLALRKAVGILGIALPIVLWLGGLGFFGTALQGSISAYYYTGMRNIFVGTQWAMGSFLFSYRGYALADDVAGKVASASALGIALFPTTPSGIASRNAVFLGHIHSAATFLFFATLAFFALVLFTKTGPGIPTPRKLLRNRVYRACGWAIIVSMLLIVVHNVLPSESTQGLEPYRPVFVVETLAILAFGSSWLVKGEALLKDET